MPKAPKMFSIRSMLQLTNLLILLAVFLAFTLYFAVTESIDIRRNAFQSMELKVRQVSSYMDDEASILSTVSQNVIYSNLVKNRFASYIEGQNAETPSEKYAQVENIRVLTDLLFAIIGPVQPVSQIYLYSPTGQRFALGRNTASDVVEYKDQPWYQKLVLGKRNQYWACVPDEMLDHFYTAAEPQLFFTLYSLYFDSYNTVQGVVEVKSPVINLHRKIKDLGVLYGEKTFLFDSEGTNIYASDSSDGSVYYQSALQESGLKTFDDEFAFHFTSEVTGFTALVVMGNDQLMEPIYEYLFANIVILAVISLATFVIFIIVANVITKPVKKIYGAVINIPKNLRNADNPESFPAVNTRLLELDALYKSLADMRYKVKESLDRELVMQNQEMQSRMLALQSQMNPHFLYNSLFAIHSMADEGMKDEIQAMCQTISRILRYISSDKELLVPLNEDVKHMEDYLQCVALRYGDDFAYAVTIPDEMCKIRVPKLCLQLIVENAIKFATSSVKPPWMLNIAGDVSGGVWKITVSDNGAGFHPEVLERLNNQIEGINNSGLLQSLELNGMGLLNVYIRFKLFYHDEHLFQIGNKPGGGAYVTIGGVYHA